MARFGDTYEKKVTNPVVHVFATKTVDGTELFPGTAVSRVIAIPALKLPVVQQASEALPAAQAASRPTSLARLNVKGVALELIHRVMVMVLFPWVASMVVYGVTATI